MREKPAKEKTIYKYIEFLKDVKCYDVFEHTELSELIAKHEINKSVRKALIDLSIIDYKDNAVWHYLSFEPSRQLAMTVLNFLLERAKKQRVIPIAGMEEMNATIRALSEKVTEYIQRRESGFKQPQTHVTNGNSSQIHSKNDYYSLFSEVDTKTDLINKAAFSIATGVYEKYGLSKDHNIYDISERNERIVFSAKDLVNQLLK